MFKTSVGAWEKTVKKIHQKSVLGHQNLCWTPWVSLWDAEAPAGAGAAQPSPHPCDPTDFGGCFLIHLLVQLVGDQS